MDSAKVNGVELEYEVVGTGEPVLLISPVLADGFLPLLSQPALTDSYQLIRYHKRGWVGSTHTPPPVSVATHAADAAALLDHLGVSRAHVAGHSSGGAHAAQLALDHPEMVHTLILLELSLLPVPSCEAFFRQVGPALEAYGNGDHEGALAIFMSVVGGTDWPSCRAMLEELLPGAVAQAIKDAAAGQRAISNGPIVTGPRPQGRSPGSDRCRVSRRSSLKGRGRSTSLVRVVDLLLRRLWARRGRRRCPGSARRADRVAAGGPGRRRRPAHAGRRRRSRSAAPDLDPAGGRCACSSAGVPAGGQAPCGAVGHPFAARRGGMECCDTVRGGRGQSEGATTPSAVGGHDLHDPRPPPLAVRSHAAGADAGGGRVEGSGCGDRAARRTPA